ncbi:hypothetical protein Pst134EA_025568 [Puccinia striiformis f. sp. tritici]|uniref:hypothetical protein n=1 Tax=Puccinia striiformis f. sp. tritici TaxID=168172 RepID=UPI0020078878|nr:hypothetical protein Pst134EA_025568 [Puccinia striiformis f. sp. tritici]KAH9451620.1 hypothetical protein Pst134EA_025568 [Puccinia striiformis f. sp. tritici]
MELRGVIPLTIFNWIWQEAVLVYHSQNTPKEEKSDKGIVTYKGKPDPKELRQTHSEWTLNHTCFRETMRKYKCPVLARWLKLHKDNCDRLREKSGFMTALRYDIIIRRNTIAFRTENNGKESFSNISIFKTDTAETVYTESRNFEELSFHNNPYARGGVRADWDPLTGMRRAPIKTESSSTKHKESLHPQAIGPGPAPTTTRASRNDRTTGPRRLQG